MRSPSSLLIEQQLFFSSLILLFSKQNSSLLSTSACVETYWIYISLINIDVLCNHYTNHGREKNFTKIYRNYTWEFFPYTRQRNLFVRSLWRSDANWSFLAVIRSEFRFRGVRIDVEGRSWLEIVRILCYDGFRRDLVFCLAALVQYFYD